MTQLPRFSVVDIETSGLSLRWHRILQVAVVSVVDGRVVE
jgi:DNA polymerase III epsilon subunit-like protein